MPTVIADDVNLEIPEWVTNIEAFRHWADMPDYPEEGNIWWLRGKVWADMSKEQYYWHLMIKGEIYRVLSNLVIDQDLGDIVTDGLLVSNIVAGISGNPDATFISHESFEEGTAVLIEGRSDGFTEVQGSPDMVLEVVSDSSETKDLVTLRQDYFVAGIREYWLVDGRKDVLSFDILRRNSKGFVLTRKQGDWVKSEVFGKSFRLVESKNRRGKPTYRLEMK